MVLFKDSSGVCAACSACPSLLAEDSAAFSLSVFCVSSSFSWSYFCFRATAASEFSSCSRTTAVYWFFKSSSSDFCLEMVLFRDSSGVCASCSACPSLLAEDSAAFSLSVFCVSSSFSLSYFCFRATAASEFSPCSSTTSVYAALRVESSAFCFEMVSFSWLEAEDIRSSLSVYLFWASVVRIISACRAWYCCKEISPACILV